MPYVAECKQCKARSPVLQNARDPDSEVVCGCCPEDHHHGQAANGCTGHLGPCGLGVVNCKVCRPITIYALGDSAQLALSTGG